MTSATRLRACTAVPALGLLLFVAFRPAAPLRAAEREADGRVFVIDGGVSRPLREVRLEPVAPAPGLPGLNFAGLGNGDYGFVPAGVPAHANGAVGATQYVQYANDSFAVFDKATGALVYGPTASAILWALGSCATTDHNGALIIRYDSAANRWVALQSAYFAGFQGPFHCLAVSTTADATGSWRSYAVGTFGPQATFVSNRLGIWPDAYYVAADVQGVPMLDSFVCAIERSAMLGIAFPRVACHFEHAGVRGFTPSDLDGSTPPPAGSPNYLLSLGSNSLDLYRFQVNFGGGSSFSGPTSIPVPPFTPACGGGSCIPQPDTAQLLDSVGDRLMHRLAYRNFGDHESLVVSHSVDAGGGVTGIRWYEIRDPGGVPTVHQQGTYSPDSSHRWMGSIAMDRSGDIALGYSVSSSSVYPSIRYAGRTPSDPLETLSAETSVIEGSGSQLTESGWGSLSGLALDPMDDCTFY